MADDIRLREWVSDQLHELLGYSLSAVVSFVIGLAKKAPSSKELALQLFQNNFKVSESTEKFAEELYCQVPHKRVGLNNYQKAEKDAADFARKQQEYKLLDADDEEDEAAATPAYQTPAKHKQLRKRKQEQDDDKESDEV
ncbi:hypothetical protein O6H91_08G050600 [Diphasiastrum complanatum]|uniref:Uncharacterized protein n=1 Tax=Diphasiastrum complanatum TaxID=34168 RepID=A0ACC2CXA2_DIPCM|nr:hypothetical protein O6H91_08G050600 [Diphasiastrum complanatum]